MNAPRLVLRNLRRRPLASVLTSLSVALGVALYLAIGGLRRAAEDGFERSAAICDLVVGAKGSRTDLVLNALYHMGSGPGNLPFAVFEELDVRPGLRWALPMAVGDSYAGRRIVGVTDTLFEKLELPQDYGKLRFAAGGPFQHSSAALIALHQELEEHLAHDADGGAEEPALDVAFVAVVGAEAARHAGLGVGARFVPVHDVQGGPGAKRHEEAAMEVVGVLEPTGTPLDRALFVPLGAYYAIAGHQPTADTSFGGNFDPLGLSAVLIGTNKNARHYEIAIWRELNDRRDVQAVRPSTVVREIFSLVGAANNLLRAVAVLVMVVALVGVLVAIYNTMGARRRDFAILRALGARRRTVLGLVMAESAALALLGGAGGLLLAMGGLQLAADRVHELSGVAVRALPAAEDLVVIPAVVLVGALAGLVPALAAYRTEAARYLSGGA